MGLRKNEEDEVKEKVQELLSLRAQAKVEEEPKRQERNQKWWHCGSHKTIRLSYTDIASGLM